MEKIDKYESPTDPNKPTVKPPEPVLPRLPNEKPPKPLPRPNKK